MKPQRERSESYLGNPSLKATNVAVNYTREQINEYTKCMNDPVYFIEKYIKIVNIDRGLIPFKLYNFQRKIVETVHNNRFTICKIPRQSGKSITVASYLIHYVIFNPSVRVAILANKGDIAKEQLDRVKTAYENLPRWLQQGVVEWNKFSIQFENGSKIIAAPTSGSAIRGGSFNCITGDAIVDVEWNGVRCKMPISQVQNILHNGMQTHLDFTPKDTFSPVANRYYDWYQKLIEKARSRPMIEGYFEKHHIIPRSLGGTNDPENIVNLTSREHYLAHRLLVKFLEGNSKSKMIYALFLMAGSGKLSEKLRVTSKQYEVAKKAFIAARMGYVHTEETKIKIGLAHKGKKQSEEAKAKVSKANKGRLLGKKMPPSHGEKISRAKMGKKIPREQVDRVNKNPEKIRKTAEKHRGMKRSAEARKNMSDAKKRQPWIPWNKGKKIEGFNLKWYHDPITKKELRLSASEEVPVDYIPGRSIAGRKLKKNV